MRHLVLFIHADPSVGPKYSAELAQVGEFDLVFVNAGAASSAYTSLASALRAPDGRVLPRLKARFMPAALAGRSYETTTVQTFSAGYGAARELLRSPADRDAIDALVMIDSLHAGFDADHTASDAQLEDFVDFALLARDGRKVFHLGHSDVATPQKDYLDKASGKMVRAFASTTQTARELVRLAGGAGGGFHVEAKNVRVKDLDEHIAALNEWGPAFLAAAMRALLDEAPLTTPAPALEEPAPPTPTQPSPRFPDLGLAVLAEYRADLERGVREQGGANRGPDVDRMLRALGVEPPGSWCAAELVDCLRRACKTLGVEPPIQGSAGAKAMMAQFQKAGRFISAADLRRDHRLARAGMISFWDRAVAGRPETAWHGHVGCNESDADLSGQYDALEGNSGPAGDRVARMPRSLHDPRLLGMGWLALDGAPVSVPLTSSTGIDPETAGRLVALSDAAMRGGGLP